MDHQPQEQGNSPPTASNSDDGLAQRIRAAREARGLSQTAVATRSKFDDAERKGISRTALIGYEAGTSRPGARELRLLCQTLQVSPNFLLFGSEHPFQSGHVALEGLRSDSAQELRQAVEIATVLCALKGHERDALMSLTLSLAGRQLGDARLGGLRATALMLMGEIERVLQGVLKGREDLGSASLEELATELSRGAYSNRGNTLKFEDGEIVGGTALYRDPDAS